MCSVKSSRFWLVKGAAKLAAPGSTIKIIAKGDNGPIEATAKVRCGSTSAGLAVLLALSSGLANGKGGDGYARARGTAT